MEKDTANAQRVANTRVPWAQLAGWAAGGLLLIRTVPSLLNPPPEAPPGVIPVAFGAGLLMLPPVSALLGRWLPAIRGRWAPFGWGFGAIAVAAVIGIAAIDPPASGAPSATPAQDAERATDDGALALYSTVALKLLAPRLKHPDSARITKLMAFRTGDKLTFCGSVNGRNSFGGYSGPEPFILADERTYLGEAEANAERVLQHCKGARAVIVPNDLL